MKNTLISAVLAAAPLTHALTTKRDLTVQTSGSWQSLGCYRSVLVVFGELKLIHFSDTQSSRTLGVTGMLGDNVSGLTCQAKCSELGYVYAGTEYSGQVSISIHVKPLSDSQIVLLR